MMMRGGAKEKKFERERGGREGCFITGDPGGPGQEVGEDSCAVPHQLSRQQRALTKESLDFGTN